MKKQKFLFTRYEINASLFQKGSLETNVNKYLHLTLMKKLENISLSSAARSGSLACLKYAHNVIRAINDNWVLKFAERSGSFDCIEYCKKHFS